MMNVPSKALRLSRNLISEAGIGLAVVALANLGFLIYLDATQKNSNPYMGILTWIVVPAILICGMLLFFVGILLERRKRHRLGPDEVPQYPHIDLNEQRTRVLHSMSRSSRRKKKKEIGQRMKQKKKKKKRDCARKSST